MEKRNYTYKGNTYAILGLCLMKDSKKNWIEAVRYRDVNNNDKGEFVRSKKQFFNRFIPTDLRVGDKILISSMTKIIGVVSVTKIDDSFAYLDKVEEKIPLPIKIEGNRIAQIGNREYFFYSDKRRSGI